MREGLPYGTAIAEHFRRPRNYGPLPNASASAEGVNPLCGDRVRVAILFDGAGTTIAEARFTANACAICVASASLLTERLRGLSRDGAAQLSDDDVLATLGSGVPAARRRCATLPLEALRRAVASVEQPTEAQRRA
jgi:nitrogen fixation NifU-like protein